MLSHNAPVDGPRVGRQDAGTRQLVPDSEPDAPDARDAVSGPELDSRESVPEMEIRGAGTEAIEGTFASGPESDGDAE